MKNTQKIALCGVFGALSITVMLLGSIIPFATYMCPAIAAFFLLPIAFEYKEKTAFTMYAAVSVLSLLFVAEKEFALIYVLIFGLYSVLKFKADRIKPFVLQMTFKTLFAVIGILACYGLLLFVFPSPVLLNDFEGFTVWLAAIFVVMLTVTFLLYDFAAGKIFLLYRIKLRPKLVKKQ